MNWRIIVGILLLAAFATAQFEYYSLRGPRPFHFGEIYWVYGAVQEYVNGQYVNIVFHGIGPGMTASPWLPNGTGIEYNYTRATALFNITNVDPRTDVEWYVYSIHFIDVWRILPVMIEYGLEVAVKSDGRPILNYSCLSCSNATSTVYFVTASYARAYSDMYMSFFNISGRLVFITAGGGSESNTTINLGNTVIHKIVKDLGTKFFCVEISYFSQPIWRYYGGYNYGPTLNLTCAPMADPPHNITIDVRPYNATSSAVDVYVDGKLFLTYFVNGSKARMYTGPYYPLDMTTASAFIMLNYPGRPLKPLGSTLLLIGNSTVMYPPNYVLKQVPSNELTGDYSWTWADSDLTWSGVYVLPGDTGSNSTVYSWPLVPVRLSGRVVELPYLAMLNASRLCRYGAVEASGEYSWVGGWIRVLGPASIYCTEYPVTVVLPNGTSLTFVARSNRTFSLSLPPIVLPNGTMFANVTASVFVEGPATVNATYSRLYRVVVETPAGAETLWLPAGAEVPVPAVDFGNGTRLAAVGARYAVSGPATIKPTYVKQYLVRLEAPANSTEVWADAGSTFTVDLPDPWEPGNGTLFKALLINGTSAREWRVDGPMTLVAQYAETYYYVEVEAPVNGTAGWMPRGAVLRFPSVVYLGNGTRLVGPNASAVEVEGPIKVEVSYSVRQYHVEVEGVERWEGWADAGSLIGLNSTAVDGVEYVPAVPALKVSAPGVYRPFFEAVYRAVVRDALGVPNPLATARLCNATSKAGLDGSVYIAVETRELCRPEVEAAPVSPYTAALIALAAAAAAAVVLRRK
jgi:hypothetical protein